MSKEARRRILGACYRFLVPIARILLTHGIGYREFDEVCRRAFVQTATKEFGIRGRETNVSRVAAMTGLTRKQVQTLRRSENLGSSEPEELLSPLADLLHVWATSDEFLDVSGRPLSLGVHEEGERNFAELVRRCMGDVPPGAVKAELLRLGAVSVSADNRLELRRRSLIPEDGSIRLESAIIYSLKGLAKTIAHNVDPNVAESDRRFERFVESRPMSQSEIREIRSLLGERLTQVSEDLDAILNSPPRIDDDSPKQRVGVGLFYTE